MVSQIVQKVTSEHLQRKAYLYVRQSSLHQVHMNRESTERQYALKQRALELGWPRARVVIIDVDQGHSGASTADRKGFQQLVAEVGMGKAGIVLGLEVSRLARNNSDWHQLLEICGLTRTLILDEDGLYNPCDFNDRLLLGLKGTMSEAELHIIKTRMRGGLLNKARRGELRLPLPAGFAYDTEDNVVLDPDKQVQQSVHLLFQTYRRIGTVHGLVAYFNKQGLLFPRHTYGIPNPTLEWKKLYCGLARNILRNPVYAGAFAYGRNHVTKTVSGTIKRIPLPREQWKVLIKEAHDGYISWEDYDKNEKQLSSCSPTQNKLNKRHTAPREGCALLQGLVFCGVCGKRMSVSYYKRKDHSIPSYICRREQTEWGGRVCQSVSGEGIDQEIGKLLIKSMTPLTLEVALSVQEELQQRLDEADRIRRQQVERAQYEVNLAQRRYMQVDPDNRLVAETLEAQWNEKLCALEKAKEEYDRLSKEDRVVMNEKKQTEILALAKDFPQLWQNPNVSDRERKRMIRLLIEDVTLVVSKDIAVHIRFKGGATKTLSVHKPQMYAERRKTKPEIINKVDQLLDHYIDRDVAKILNEQGYRSSGDGLLFTHQMVGQIQRNYGLKTRQERLRERGMLTIAEVAERLDICVATARRWQKKGLFRMHQYANNRYLYEPPVKEDHEKFKLFKNRVLLHKNV